MMSSHFCASIRIGGRVRRSKIEPLLRAIREAVVSPEWGGPPFLPKVANELMDASRKSWLQLCDERADDGEFPELEATCRKLGLAYSRHSEASFDCDAQLADWRPGMNKPLIRIGSNTNWCDSYVPTGAVRNALQHLKAKRIREALHALQQICPDISELPPLDVV